AADAGDIAQLRSAFVDAARRADRAGFDAIEVQGAHGYLLHAFQSPLTNDRGDGYGGSSGARLRFYTEVIAAIRDAWPAHKAMGVRVTGSDWLADGLTLDDWVLLCATLTAIGVDYVVPSGGNIAPGVKFPPAEPGYMVEF